MVEVAASEEAIRAVDGAKNEVPIRVDGWAPATDGPALPRRVDTAVVGTTRGLGFPESAVSIEGDRDDGWTMFDDRAGPFELAGGHHVVQVAATILVYVALDGRADLGRDLTDGTFAVRFDRPTPVTIGFRSQVDGPRERLTVPRTVAGATVAIRHLSAAITTDTPDKSYPTQRDHPPAIEFGSAVEVPAAVRRDAARSAIAVRVPRSLGDLVVVAPLVYYLHADLALADVAEVTVEAPTLAAPLRLGTGAALERRVARLLHRVFYLDCLVRNAGPYGLDLQEARLLDRLDVDPARVYSQSGAERLATYLDLDYARVVDRLPDWHLSVVMDPTLANVPAVPALVDRMSLVQRPRPVDLRKETLVAESLGRSYQDRRRTGAVPDYDAVRNETRLATRQGWLAAGVPVDAFRATIEAFENRSSYHRRTGPRSVVVVINDDSMLDERAGVERIYRSRAAELAIEVEVVESTARDELARRLESPVDFLHYIGHCDTAGLQCADGSFDVATLDRSTVQTFFLNACGSFDQGLALVRRGSVAGAVTTRHVLNPEATRVGVSFARLVMHGFSVDHALGLASRQSVTGWFYAVVGDGTHRLAQGEDVLPAVLTAERRSHDEVTVRFDFPPGPAVGGAAKPTLPHAEEHVLRGRPWSTTLDPGAFGAFLRAVNVPVVFDGSFYWSTELADVVAPERASGGRFDNPA